MVEEVKIEQLESSDKTELFEVLTQAFKDTLWATLATEPRIIRRLVKTFQSLFGEKTMMLTKLYLFGRYRFADLLSYGIRKEGKLVCVALLSDSAAKPKLSILSTLILWPIEFLISLIFRVGRILRWRTALEFEMVSKEMSEYWKGRYLELVMFGTLPVYQKQGFGREMLRFIYGKAESEGYEGIILTAIRDTPSFHLYIKEGFTVEKDLDFASGNIALMQLTLNPSSTASNSG